MSHPVLNDIQRQLARLDAEKVDVHWSEDFEPAAGPLVKVQLDSAYWHLLPERLRDLLATLDDGAGSEAIRRAIERHGTFVWHGPSPPGSRDTSG